MMKTQSAVALFMLFFCGATVQADVTVSFGSGPNQFNIDFVTIGNPGNAADATGAPNQAGSVGYVYNIGKYEISRDAIEKANAEGNLGITLFDLSSSGTDTVTRPAVGVSWNEAARFVNWLNTSRGFQPAYKFAVQPGDAGYSADANIQLWQSGDSGYNVANRFRNSRAHYFLPSVHEWYKAAYYDPNANGGTGGYWDYPTGSDTPPTPVSGGAAAGTAVYSQLHEQGPADITNAGGLSPYGVMGLGGNAWEWEETEYDLVNNDPSSDRGRRGNDWRQLICHGFGCDDFADLSASARNNLDPTVGDLAGLSPPFLFSSLGFRVASIPEPSIGLLGALGMLAPFQWRRRSR